MASGKCSFSTALILHRLSPREAHAASARGDEFLNALWTPPTGEEKGKEEKRKEIFPSWLLKPHARMLPLVALQTRSLCSVHGDAAGSSPIKPKYPPLREHSQLSHHISHRVPAPRRTRCNPASALKSRPSNKSSRQYGSSHPCQEVTAINYPPHPPRGGSAAGSG